MLRKLVPFCLLLTFWLLLSTTADCRSANTIMRFAVGIGTSDIETNIRDQVGAPDHMGSLRVSLSLERQPRPWFRIGASVAFAERGPSLRLERTPFAPEGTGRWEVRQTLRDHAEVGIPITILMDQRPVAIGISVEPLLAFEINSDNQALGSPARQAGVLSIIHASMGYFRLGFGYLIDFWDDVNIGEVKDKTYFVELGLQRAFTFGAS